MDIRETLGQMVRGSVANVLGHLVTFGEDGIFNVLGSDSIKGPIIITKSLKEVVAYFDSVRCPAPAVGIIVPEAVTDQEQWEERVNKDSKIVAPKYPDIMAAAREANIPATQLYGRSHRPVSPEEVAYNSAPIPGVGTLIYPAKPYGAVDTDGLKELCRDIHRYNVNAGWWTDINTGEKLERNVPEMLMLIVSEVAEAMEGYRKDLMDDKLPHRKMIEVELADALIRICDTAEGLGLDLAGAVKEKVLFNVNRPDHKIENRLKEGGKKF